MLKKFILFIVLLILGLGFWGGLQLFTVKHIACQTVNQTKCETTLQTALEDKLLGTSLFFTDFTTILHNEPFASLPYTLHAYQKSLPSTVLVTFNQEPLQYLLNTNDEQILAVGSEGSIVSTQEPPAELPTITINQPAKELVNNEQLDQQYHHPLAALINSLYKYEIIFQNVEWNSDEEIIINLSSKQKVLLDTSNPALAVQKLRILLDSQEVESIAEPVSEIDLRFDMPVLRTTQ